MIYKFQLDRWHARHIIFYTNVMLLFFFFSLRNLYDFCQMRRNILRVGKLISFALKALLFRLVANTVKHDPFHLVPSWVYCLEPFGESLSFSSSYALSLTLSLYAQHLNATIQFSFIFSSTIIDIEMECLINNTAGLNLHIFVFKEMQYQQHCCSCC